MFSLYKLVDTVVESRLAKLDHAAAYFVIALLGGLIRNIGTRGEICGYCMILLPKYLDICNLQLCRSNF